MVITVKAVNDAMQYPDLRRIYKGYQQSPQALVDLTDNALQIVDPKTSDNFTHYLFNMFWLACNLNKN